MFYAASEIVFWILLSAIIGCGIGYGISQAKSVQIGKRLTESRADAPMERELAIAWDTIEDLNRRLQVAHETIRGGISDESVGAESDLVAPVGPLADDGQLADDVGDIVEDSPEADIPEGDAPPPQDDGAKDDESTSDEPQELAAPLVHTVAEAVPADEDAGTSDGVVGSRLADRVASASIGNQVEVIKNVEF